MLKYFVMNNLKGENTMEINKTTKIGDIVENAPDKVDILLNAGMHCLGCPASQAETLEEACMVHGIDVDELVAELNK
jgi:hybrid cluster-associated redox disulfide protein